MSLRASTINGINESGKIIVAQPFPSAFSELKPLTLSYAVGRSEIQQGTEASFKF